MPVSLDLLIFAALFSLLLASLLGVLFSWIWALRRLWRGIPLLDDMNPVAVREVPWGAPAVLLTVVLYLAVSYTVVKTYETATGRHLPRQEKEEERKAASPMPGKPAELVELKPAAEPKQAAAELKQVAAGGHEKDSSKGEPETKTPEDKNAQSQAELMVQSAIINLLLLVTVPLLVFRMSRATHADFGWDTRDWQRQVFQGARAGMLITPVVFAVQSITVRIWPSQKHPLEQMVLERFTPGVAVLAVVSAMFLAPVVEELLFRGVLQQWLIKLFTDRPLVTEEPAGWSATAPDGDDSTWEPEDLPEGLTPPDPGRSMQARGPAAAAVLVSILVTSGLFAGMHLAQWPAPIAIFVLSIWLGTVYQRSGSLIAAMALHGTFNGFSTLMLLLEALSRRLAPGAPHAVLAALVTLLT
jgi:membrane protease YdiL (CAAX protease family)